MKRMVLLGIGAAAAFVALFGANIGGVHVGAVARVLLLSAGLVFMALAVYLMGGARIRAHVAANRSRYVQGAAASAFLLTGAAVLAAYVYFASLGTWTDWAPTTNYYDRLAMAFRAGHPYVPQTPDPALLALPNPYDPDTREGIPGTGASDVNSLWDMSLYNGKAYPYWGPAPAVLVLGIRAFYPVEIGDQVLTLAFLAGSFIFESLLLIYLRRRFFSDVPAWTVIPGMLLAGFVNPIPWLLFLPRIYEAAIAAGQFFLMAGLYFVFGGLGGARTSIARVFVASILLVSAVASRATLAIPVALLALLVVVWLLHGDSAARRASLCAALAFAVPLIAGALILAWYNFIRFGSFLEFGYRYQLTVLDQNRFHNVLFSPMYLLPNAYIYLLNIPALDNLFPFVKPLWNEPFIRGFETQYHSIYNSERMIGLVFSAPFLLLAMLPAGLQARALLHVCTAKSKADTPRSAATTGGFLRWVVITLSALALLELMLVFLVFYATMRYFMDAVPTLVLLSMVGFWLGWQRLAGVRWGRAAYVAACMALIALSVIISILAGFSSDIPRLKAADPSLLPHLRLFFMALARHLSR